jgi:hypothetical protein
MQSSLRAIVLFLGALLLVTAFAVFGRDGFQASSALVPAILGMLGAGVLAIGFLMPGGGLWRRNVSDEHVAPANDDLHRASFLHDEQSASSSGHDAD